MFNFKSPFIWLSISLTCCALALGLVPQFRSDAVLSTVDETTEQSLDDATGIAPAIYSASPHSRGNSRVLDQMPLFPGEDCGDITHYEARRYCSGLAMRKFVDDNVSYPEEARNEGVVGTAVVRFAIEPHGAITEISIAINPGGGLGEAAAKVVEKMKADGLRWEPGLRKGKPVRVEYYLPVRFEL